MSADVHEHRASVIRFDGETEWEICSCGVKRPLGGEWFVPRTASIPNRQSED